MFTGRGDIKQLILQDSNGMVPLHLAASKNFFSVVEVIVSYSAVPMVVDEDGNTPMHSCAFSSKCELPV